MGHRFMYHRKRSLALARQLADQCDDKKKRHCACHRCGIPLGTTGWGAHSEAPGMWA